MGDSRYCSQLGISVFESMMFTNVDKRPLCGRAAFSFPADCDKAKSFMPLTIQVLDAYVCYSTVNMTQTGVFHLVCSKAMHCRRGQYQQLLVLPPVNVVVV